MWGASCTDCTASACSGCAVGMLLSPTSDSCIPPCPSNNIQRVGNNWVCQPCPAGEIAVDITNYYSKCISELCAVPIWAFVVIAVCYVMLIVVATTVLDDRRMGQMVGAVIVLQRCSVIGSAAATSQTPTVRVVFSYLSLLNLDVSALRFTCYDTATTAIPNYELFWYTLAIVAWAAVMFVAGAGVRAATLSASKLAGISRWRHFKRRAVHAMIILGTGPCHSL